MNLTNFQKLFIDGVEMKELYVNGVCIWKSDYSVSLTNPDETGYLQR